MEKSDARPSPELRRVALDSAAIARLMEEVRNDADRHPTAYNRMHNRHNR